MREELKRLYQEYKDELDKAQLWNNESLESFWKWLLTGEL
jgi:hypothetical protein